MFIRFPSEFKASAVDSSGFFAGHAATFNTPDMSGDIILPTAFHATLAQAKASGRLPALLWAHDSHAPLGRLTTLREDRLGLYAEAQLTLEAQAAKEVYALMKDGAVSGLSIGYTLPDGGAEYRGSNRLLKQIDLLEVSLVSIPMHPDSRVTAVKAMDCTTLRELEHLLRESLSLSSRKSHAAANALWPLLSDRDDQNGDREDRTSAAPGELVALAREFDQITKLFR